MLPLRATTLQSYTPLQSHNDDVPRLKILLGYEPLKQNPPCKTNPPWKEDSLANASSGARQGDVRTRSAIANCLDERTCNIMPARPESRYRWRHRATGAPVSTPACTRPPRGVWPHAPTQPHYEHQCPRTSEHTRPAVGAQRAAPSSPHTPTPSSLHPCSIL